MSSLSGLTSNGNQPENVDVNSRSPLAGRLVAVCFICITLGVIFHFIPSNWAIWSAVKLVSASLTILIVPGVLLLLIVKLNTPLSILEIGGLGAALSVGILTLLTIICMLTHTSFLYAVSSLVVSSFALVSIAFTQNAKVGLTTVTASRPEWLLLVGVTVIGLLLFLTGSPLFSAEDQIHIAVVRRLAILQDPSIYNIYLTPNFVYTYPFPVTHVIFALTSILSGLDVLFVYHKMRFLWAILAIVCVYLATKRIFNNSILACVSGWTCIVFAAFRVFGEASTLMWQQMAPFSHASDVAMGVLLPLLLVSTFYYLGSDGKRDTRIFLLIAILMALALTVAKIREIVQFIVYSGSFITIIFLQKKHRHLVTKMAILGGATLAIVGFYAVWHRFTVASVATIVETNKADILNIWNNMSMFDYVAKPFNDGRFVNHFDLFYYDLNALALLGSPLVFLAFLRNRLVLLLWASLFAYLLIVRIPILAIHYLLFTYFDMLSSPVRNVIFFIYILISVMIYMTASVFSKLKPFALVIISLIGLAYILSELAEWMRGILMVQPDWLFIPLLIALPFVLVLSFTPWGKTFGNLWFCEPTFSTRTVVCAGILIISLGFFLYKPDVAFTIQNNPVTNNNNLEQVRMSAATPLRLIEYTVSGSNKIIGVKGTSDVPNNEITQWIKQNVTPDEVFAVNMFNGNILTTFVPQRVPAWPLYLYESINYCTNFPKYCDLADSAFGAYGTQPFFNDKENKEERIKFLGNLGISYVLVDPPYQVMMERVLSQYPEIFIKVYDKNAWSIFKVNRL